MSAFDPYNSIVPVFVHTEIPDRIIQIGSAVFVELSGEPFLFTAAHVTDEKSSGNLLAPTAEGFSEIEGYLGHIDIPPNAARSDDQVDIAYWRLSSKFAGLLKRHFAPLPQHRIELIVSPLELSICSVVGYPASKAKRKVDVFSSEHYAFRGCAGDIGDYSALGLSADVSIAIHFQRKNALHPETGKSFPTPGLKGTSGGGIFAWPKGEEFSQDWSKPMLVGIMHTYKEKEGIIIGTTLLPIMAAVSLGRMKGFGGIR